MGNLATFGPYPQIKQFVHVENFKNQSKKIHGVTYLNQVRGNHVGNKVGSFDSCISFSFYTWVVLGTLHPQHLIGHKT